MNSSLADPLPERPKGRGEVVCREVDDGFILYDPEEGMVHSLNPGRREGNFRDELRFIYRRMLSTPHNDMRTVRDGSFAPFPRAVRVEKGKDFERAEFQLKGTMGRRPTAFNRSASQRGDGPGFTFSITIAV